MMTSVCFSVLQVCFHGKGRESPCLYYITALISQFRLRKILIFVSPNVACRTYSDIPLTLGFGPSSTVRVKVKWDITGVWKVPQEIHKNPSHTVSIPNRINNLCGSCLKWILSGCHLKVKVLFVLLVKISFT